MASVFSFGTWFLLSEFFKHVDLSRSSIRWWASLRFIKIFSWLPVKLLMCLSCISIFCIFLISELNFVDIHSCRSMTRPDGTKFFLSFQTEKFIEHDPAYTLWITLMVSFVLRKVYCKPSAIAAFDVNFINFKIIALSKASHWVYPYELIEVNGKLTVINYGMLNRYYDLWILKQTSKREQKRHIIQYWLTLSRDGKVVFSKNLKSCVLWWHCFLRRHTSKAFIVMWRL